MRTNKIDSTKSYQYLIDDRKCYIVDPNNLKRLTTMLLPQVPEEDMDIILREKIVFTYGIHPDNLKKTEIKIRKKKNDKIVES